MRSKRQLLHLTALLSLFALAGCDTILGSYNQRVVGILGPEASVVQAPEAAVVNEPVTIRVETGLYGGCSRKGETEVERNQSLVVVRPFDYLTAPEGDSDCVQMLRFFLHEVELEFDEPGIVSVRVEGRDGSGADRVIEREIMVEEG